LSVDTHEVRLFASWSKWICLLTLRIRGKFTPLNTIESTETPSFRGTAKDRQQQYHSAVETPHGRSPSRNFPYLQRNLDSATAEAQYSPTLSNLGDSSSLSDSSLEITGRPSISTFRSDEVDAASGSKSNTNTRSAAEYLKMVRERSPAKVPLHPVEPNDQPQPSQGNPSKPLSSIPRFGEPTLPQSPLYRSAQQDHSELFIQPKSRPEQHRPKEKHGTSFAAKQLTLLICI
jgi:hypothetical protein